MSRLFSWLFPSMKVARLAAYTASVNVGLAVVACRAMKAYASDAVLQLGHELVGLADYSKGADTIELNGERFHHSMTISSDSVPAALDRVEAHCAANPGLLAQAAGESALSQRTAAAQWVGHPGIVREERADRGMVVCFTDKRGSGTASLREALDRFAQSTNLSDFGRLRYVFAERKNNGKTRVVTLWADTGLNLRGMFPSDGDAVGTDSGALPRPPQSRRLLSATAPGMSFESRLYRSERSREQVKQFYNAWMKERGWATINSPATEGGMAYLRKDGYQTILAILPDGEGSYVTLTESGGSDAMTQLRVGAN